jgi:uncharacterized membrane protein
MSAAPSPAAALRSASRTELSLGLAGTALSLLGLALASYLTYAHYTDARALVCSDKGTINCLKVTTSSYAVQHGVPLAVLGLVFFAVMLPLQVPASWARSDPVLRRARLAVATLGAAAAVWLVWVELFRLDAVCLYCTGVHIVAVALFALTGIGTALTAPLD